ncbi:MAG TPA: HAD family hydrolase [Methanocella sp.]|nr:HAD family hydrolase [Methanocella sp.]
MSCIEAVTFDLWFTLIAHDEYYDDRLRNARTTGIRKALQKVGVEVRDDVITRAFQDSEMTLQNVWSLNHDLDTPDQAKILLRSIGIETSPEVVAAIETPYANAVLEVEPYLVSGAIETLEALQHAGNRLALISNTGRTPGRAMRQIMRRLGILDFFEVTTFSNEVGYLKPDGRIFAETLRRLGVPPGNAVHVGDHQVLDVQGSKEHGMRCVHMTRYAPACNGKYAPDRSIESLRQLPEVIHRLKDGRP